MPELSIHLRETFNDDALVIRVNGVERRRLDGVTTRLLLGYAEIVGEELAAGPNLVEIELQSKGRSASVQIDGSQDADVVAAAVAEAIDAMQRDAAAARRTP